MTSDDLPHTAAPSAATLPASTRLGAVHLTVSDLARSAAWYRDVAGLQIREQGEGTAALGAGGADLVVLHELPGALPGGPRAGLFHIALLHDSRAELGHALRRIAASGEPLTGACRSRRVPRRSTCATPTTTAWRSTPTDRARRGRRPLPGARVGMFTAPLDLEDLLAGVATDAPRPQAGPGLAIGHVHLQVSDVAPALGFYRDALGLELMVAMPGAAFLAAGPATTTISASTAGRARVLRPRRPAAPGCGAGRSSSATRARSRTWQSGCARTVSLRPRRTAGSSCAILGDRAADQRLSARVRCRGPRARQPAHVLEVQVQADGRSSSISAIAPG